MKGSTDTILENSVGMNREGEIIVPKNKSYIVNETVTIQPGELIIIGSDFFSDYTRAGRNLNEFIDVSPKDFNIKVSSKDAVKGDDATLIVIDPEKLK